MQTNSDEEDAKTSKSAVLTKSQSLDRCDGSQEDGEKSGFAIRRSRTLPGRIKTSPEQPEDKAGTYTIFIQINAFSEELLYWKRVGYYRKGVFTIRGRSNFPYIL